MKTSLKKQKGSFRKVFLSGLFRLRTVAIILTVVTIVLSCWMATSRADEVKRFNYEPVYIPEGDDFDPAVYFPGVITASSSLTAFLPWIIVVFNFILFGFLFRRKEADVFHALPHSRAALFGGFFTASFTLTAAIVLLNAGAWLLNIILLLPDRVTINWEYFGCIIGMSLLSTLLLGAISMLAIVLSGEIFTALFRFLLFSVGIRTVLLYLVAGDNHYMYSYSYRDTVWYAFFQPDWFLPNRLHRLARLGAQWDWMIETERFLTENLICTAAVAILLLAISYFLFSRRKSEVAGCVIPSRTVHGFTRYLLVLAIVSWMLRYYASHIVMDMINHSPAVLELYRYIYQSVPFAVLAGYLYEGATTRSFGKTMRASGRVFITAFSCVIVYIFLSGLLRIV